MPSRILEEGSVVVTIPDNDEDSFVESEPEPDPYQELKELYESQQLRKLFIGNLSYSTDSEALKEYFIKYGEIEECNVPVDSRTKLSKGFGFVIYRHSKTLDSVMKHRPHKLDGRMLEPRRAIRREEADNPAANASTDKMYVGPINKNTNEASVREYFSSHGNVVEVEISKKGDHCFVTFDDFDPVDKCVNMKKHMLNGVIAMCKKGLTKTAMIEADQRYHQRKRRRQEREEREKRDYDLAKHGYNPQRDFWRSGHERAPHRKYPQNFGREDPRNDRKLKKSPKRSRSPRRYTKNSQNSNTSGYEERVYQNAGPKTSGLAYPQPPPHYPPPPPPCGYPYGDPTYGYPPPPREYIDRYYEHYYGQAPPLYYEGNQGGSTYQNYTTQNRPKPRPESQAKEFRNFAPNYNMNYTCGY